MMISKLVYDAALATAKALPSVGASFGGRVVQVLYGQEDLQILALLYLSEHYRVRPDRHLERAGLQNRGPTT